MLGVFSGGLVAPPEELVVAGSRTPSPKTRASELVATFLEASAPAISINLGGDGSHLAYSHHNESPFSPRSFAVKENIFCVFEGVLDNLGSLKQHYGLSKSANEVLLGPLPPSQMVGHLRGSFAFIIFDASTSSLFVASDPHGKVPLYWGITADGFLSFANDVNLLKGACGKSLASFPQGCFYSTSLGGLKSYEYPKNKITAIPASEEEIWGATFKVGAMNPSLCC
ncbi:unnamed protein product [Spirodela intermedia]|uniref:Glutamine amidotransferase type-2 domain-containing protein n=1 Tax=Spirodela intermedia TaxID=51605 RepID=A0A7I8IZW4_SPIIN|nr:unnamed protein product [Spirodela intermedia]CAA6663506.1 unnamed protein product [Spirodela intermedia]